MELFAKVRIFGRRDPRFDPLSSDAISFIYLPTVRVAIQVPSHVVVGKLKRKFGKNLFRKLNEHSKELQAKQEEIAKKYNLLSVEYDELEHLKTPSFRIT